MYEARQRKDRVNRIIEKSKNRVVNIRNKFLNEITNNRAIQRLRMDLVGTFPTLNDIENDNTVFADANIESFDVYLPHLKDDEKNDDGNRKLYVGQDYLNTDLSKQYKSDKGTINSQRISMGTERDEYFTVIDGNHRTVWGLYHNKTIDYIDMGYKGHSVLLKDMKYKSLNRPTMK